MSRWFALGLDLRRSDRDDLRFSFLLPLFLAPFFLALPGAGYWMRVTPRIASSHDRSLPSRYDPGGLLTDGTRWLGTSLGRGLLVFFPVGSPLHATIAILDAPS